MSTIIHLSYPFPQDRSWADEILGPCKPILSEPNTPLEPQTVVKKVAKSWADVVTKPPTLTAKKDEKHSIDVNGKSYEYLQKFGEEKHVATFYDQLGQPYFKVTVSTLPTDNFIEIGFTAGNGSAWNQPLAFKTLGDLAEWLTEHNYREQETDKADGVPSNPIHLFSQDGIMDALVYKDVYHTFAIIFRRIALIHCAANEGKKGFYGSKPRSNGKYFPKSPKGVGQTRKLFTLP